MKDIYTNPYVLNLDDARATLDVTGGKGASLARLASAGLPVPGGFHISTAAYRRFVSENALQARILAALEAVDPAKPETLEAASRTIHSLFDQAHIPTDITRAITEAYTSLNNGAPVVAVRSSATAEDLPEASFAGQQDTFLNIQGTQAVQDAIKRCWASLWTARAIGYRARQGIPPGEVSLAVVVQQLVPAEAAGIMFTANPLNGRRDQIVINAAWGLGEAIVGGAVTPDTFIVTKAGDTVGDKIERDIADKQVMTVRVARGTEEQPVPNNMRNLPVLNDEEVAELAKLGMQIEDLYDMPVDIEWTLAQGTFAIVQARPITALPEPVAPPPEEWPLPNPKGHYMRVSIVELMPDPLSPLFATLGLNAITRGVQQMVHKLMKVKPEAIPDDFLCTINGYAYEAVSFTPKQWWLLLSGMVPKFPYMLKNGVKYWQNVALPHYQAVVVRWEQTVVQELAVDELWASINEILNAFGEHLATLMASTMGPSAGAEGLFTQVYEKMIKHSDEPEAPTFLLGFDSIPIEGEKALYDLAMWCKEQPALASYLLDTPAEKIAGQWKGTCPSDEIAGEIWEIWQERFRDYLVHYGYPIYDLDFAETLPVEEPTPMLETLKLFISGQAKNPHKRQQAFVERREQAIASVKARVKGLKRWAFEKTLNMAQKQAPLREDGIAEIGLGYPLLREMLHTLGEHFVRAGAIEANDDIFWLEQAEVEAGVAALEQGDSLDSLAEAVEERKALWRGRKMVIPPPQLPWKDKFMGFSMDTWLAADESSQTGDTLKGLGASPGKVTATARVLNGPEDFDQMAPGDILVAAITTPAWTPLFTMAAGVVTDVGGPLSHSSIVAREYGIPAVLGTGVATKRIQSGQRITVDGSAGQVHLAE